jgi:FkbM family methyltransferase
MGAQSMKQVRGIWLPDGDVHLADQIMHPNNVVVAGKGTYQCSKYLAALEYVKGRRHAVDVGANVGLWSRLMVMDFESVTAIEPVHEHRECFALNVDGAKMLPVAVADQPGQLHIRIPSTHVMSAYIAEDGEAVDVVTLDSLELGSVDFLKIDIEGYEYPCIVGGEQTIRSARPVIILEQKPGHAERYGRGRWDAVRLLEDWGMKEMKVINGDHIMVYP